MPLLNRARMATRTVGTGTITLGPVVAGHFSFAEAGAVDGAQYSYVLEEGSNFEIGVGTYNAGANTLTRDTVTKSKISGSAGTAKISLLGSAIVSCIARAEDITDPAELEALVISAASSAAAAAASATSASTSATTATTQAGLSSASATLSQAWAAGTLPGGAGTKSAREYAIEAAAGAGKYPAISGEVGVLNDSYPVGDVRRYGVEPDGTTNWESSFPTRMTNIYTNSINPKITVYWPPGLYNTGMNLTSAYSGSKMSFDGAIFANIVHIIWDGITRINNIRWTGDLSSYDRLGLDGADNVELPAFIRMLNNASINPQGTGNRGVHILNSSNVRWGTAIVDDTGPTSSTLPGAQTIWAGFALQSSTLSGFQGAIWVKNASGHGVYVNALDVDLDIRVDGYGKSAIDFTSVAFLIGSDSEAQSEQGCGIWLNRCTGRVSLRVSQANSSPADDVYSVLIDETGISTVASSRHQILNITRLEASVGNGNRGVCIGEGLTASPVCNVSVSGPTTITLRSGAATLESGYSGFNILAPSSAANSYRRFATSLPMVFAGFTAAGFNCFQATAVALTTAYTEINIDSIITESQGAVGTVALTGTSGVLRGRIGFVRVFYNAGSGTTPIISLTGLQGFRLESYIITANASVSTPGISVTSCTDCYIGSGVSTNFGGSTTGAAGISGNTRLRMGPFYATRTSVANTAVRFSNTNTDCTFEGFYVTNHAVGFDNGTSMVFTRCSAVNMTATGNTDDTDLTTTDFPAANQIGCTNFAV